MGQPRFDPAILEQIRETVEAATGDDEPLCFTDEAIRRGFSPRDAETIDTMLDERINTIEGVRGYWDFLQSMI